MGTRTRKNNPGGLDPLESSLGDGLPEEQRILVGVSGGRDSMALLHALEKLDSHEPVVCHLDHGLRGEESEKDAAFVRAAAEEKGHRVHLGRVEVEAIARREKLSIETAAREARYRFFAEVARRESCPRVLLAHHGDDQIETVIMNFFRGTGPAGLAGMSPRSVRIVDGVELLLIRPWLELFREDIDRYIGKWNIPYREDDSNREPFALRNRIRHHLLPVASETFDRDVRRAVLRLAEVSRKQEEWIAEHGAPLPATENGSLPVPAMRKLPSAERDRLLLAWLRESGVPDCGFAEVERVSEVLLSPSRPAKTNLPGGIHARRKEGKLFLEFPDGDFEQST